jgi:hypothetical protein
MEWIKKSFEWVKENPGPVLFTVVIPVLIGVSINLFVWMNPSIGNTPNPQPTTKPSPPPKTETLKKILENYDQGIEYFQEGNFVEAIPSLEQVLTLIPNQDSTTQTKYELITREHLIKAYLQLNPPKCMDAKNQITPLGFIDKKIAQDLQKMIESKCKKNGYKRSR